MATTVIIVEAVVFYLLGMVCMWVYAARMRVRLRNRIIILITMPLFAFYDGVPRLTALIQGKPPFLPSMLSWLYPFMIVVYSLINAGIMFAIWYHWRLLGRERHAQSGAAPRQ